MSTALPAIVVFPFVFVFGALIGSFLNVVVYRLPETLLAQEDPDEAEEVSEIPQIFAPRFLWALKYIAWDIGWMFVYLFKELPKELWLVLKSISFPASHCPTCKQEIAWYDNLPVLSWFILRGKCRMCQTAFSFRYPLNEFICGLLFLYVYGMTGLNIDFFLWSGFVALLWVIFWIDLDHQFIFNVTTYPSIFIGIVYNVSKGTTSHSLWGILIGFALFEALIFLSIVVLGKEGMGGGDVRLVMMLGAWLGPIGLSSALALAFILGSAVGIVLLLRQRESIPFSFGPALVLGGLVSMRLGEKLWTWYINSIYGNALGLI
ncbi:MAG: prepilin peptidase [Candidatus Sericytochromatia bacterium]|nr:prepilin peptidase [Candidatus Sericytochromatia bacterium]